MRKILIIKKNPSIFLQLLSNKAGISTQFYLIDSNYSKYEEDYSGFGTFLFDTIFLL